MKIKERREKTLNFTLFNDDCIEVMQSQNFIDLTKGKKCIIVTDPPFNVGYHYDKYKDNLDEEEYYNLLDTIFNMYSFPFVVIHYPENLYKISFQTGYFPERVISWVYNSNTAKQHRDIAFFGVKPNFKQVLQPYKNLNDKRIKERIAKGCEGAKLYDWWQINQVKNGSKQKTEHPCQMPLEVMKNIIGLLPYECCIIDTFMGSGTTGLAVKEMNRLQNANRNFIGIEMDEKYFKIAKNRIDNEILDVEDEKVKNIFDFMEGEEE